MAESLKSLLDETTPARLAGLLHGAWPRLDRRAFAAQALQGWDALELMQRGQRLADLMHQHLPGDFARAAPILVDALGPPMPLDTAGEPCSDGRPYSAFLYLPHSLYLARHGLGHFELAMAAQHALTQRFTAEFCLRPYLEQHAEATLARLMEWTADPSAHVRRLVSEGSRPRLPWAPRLRAFMLEPRPLLPLLQRLRDDPSSYVRRSVANHLNDIGKDHPQLLTQLAREWLVDAPEPRRRLVRHALRFAIKRGDHEALDALGVAHEVQLKVHDVAIEPARPRIGARVDIRCTLHNATRRPQHVLADLRVAYVKADGSTRAKVFKLRELELPAGASQPLAKRLSLAQMTTRIHHPGRHRVELMLNGRALALGQFDLRAA